MAPSPEDLLMPCEITGTGEPVVLVPGGLTGWISWIPHAEQLASTRRVIQIQLLNVDYGLRNMPLPAGYSVETESQALGRTLDAAGVGRADFAGWSYGALALLDFALDYPNRVRSLTLIEPGAFWVLRSRGPLNTAVQEIQQKSRSLGPGEISEDQFVQFLHFAGFVPRDVAPQSLPQWPVWTQHRRSLRIGDAEIRHEDEIRRVRAFPNPVLLFKGIGSTDHDREIVDILGQEFPQAQVRELAGGHALHVASMPAFMEIFGAFLAQLNR